MVVDEQSNLLRLQNEGLIRDELPAPYAHVIEGLTREEVDILIAVKKRLDAADEWHGAEPVAPGQPAHFIRFVIY